MALSEREIDFCKAFIETEGRKSWKEDIADSLKIAVSTVKTHKRNVFEKLLVETLQELMHFLLTSQDWQYTEWELLKTQKEKHLH